MLCPSLINSKHSLQCTNVGKCNLSATKETHEL